MSENLREWETRAGSIVRTALDATFRERCLVHGHGYSVWYVPGTLRIVVAMEAPNESFRCALRLSPSWGNEDAARHAIDALRRLPTLEAKGGAS